MENTYSILDVDFATGIETQREATSEEVEQMLAQQQAWDALQAEQEAKVAARESALAKLAELGLTAEEIAAL